MKYSRLLSFAAGLAISLNVAGQTIILQPDGNSGKDALIRISDNGATDGNTNFGTDQNFKASRTSVSSVWYKTRSLIQFDLSAIPRNAIITSATLTLYGLNHSTAGQSNAGVLQRVTGYWDESTVTWNNQPSSRVSGEVAIASSTSATQNYSLDVKNSVQEMVQNPAGNFGWLIKLNGEGTAATAELYFASSDYTTAASRPKLEITYLILGLKQTAASGPAVSDGAVDLTVSGGTAPYTYSWTNSAGSVIATTQDISSVAPGTYMVTVTDAASKVAYSYAVVGSKGTAATVNVQPSGNYGKDALLSTYDSGPYAATAPNTNYGAYANYNAYRWTNGGNWFRHRGMISYDLTSIPSYAVVTDAKLYLYGLDHSTSGQSNASTLQRISEPWNEASVTWNTQPAVNATGSIAIAQSTSATQTYTLSVTSHVQDMIRNPESNFGWMIKLNGENNTQYTRLVFASSDYTTDATKRPKLEITFVIPYQEDIRNWVNVESFDNNGNVMAQSRTYLDALGRPVQQQSLDIANGNVLASQNVFDAFGRSSLQTLAAPLFQNGIYYKDGFIKDGSGNNYSYDDFDKPITTSNLSGEVNNPGTVNNSTQGTLGWYYSNGNTAEAYVPASSYPYYRTEFYGDPMARSKRVAMAGESHKMGSGHEQKVFYMSNAGELYYVFGYKGSAIVGLEDNAAVYAGNENLNASKIVTVDADGKTSITYKTLSGLTIATCRSGIQGGSCIKQKVSQKMYYYGEKGVSIHLPQSCDNTLKLKISVDAQSNGISPSEGHTGYPQKVDYTITDLTNGKVLVLNTDYTFNRVSTSRLITFINSYANKELFLRVSFNYSSGVTFNTSVIPDLAVEYELDYDNWSLQFYNKAGQPVRSVPPNAINCTYSPVVSNTITNKYNTYAITQYSPPVNQSLQNTSHTNTSGTDKNYFYTIQATTSADPNLTTTGSVTAVSSTSTGSDINNASITDVIESGGQANGPNVPPANENMDHYWGSVELTFQLFSGGSAIPESIIPKSKMYLQASYYYDMDAPSTPPEQISMGPYPGWEARMNVPDKILKDNSYTNLDLRLVDVKASMLTPGPTYRTYSGGSPTGEYLIVNKLIDYLRNNFRIGVTKQLNTYATPNPYNNSLASTIAYNKLNWPIKSTTPDEGTVDVVYDTEGKIRFSQNAKQAASSGKFTYVNYDRAGRVVETGEYDPALTGGTLLVFQAYTAGGGVPSAPPSGTSVHAIIDNLDWSSYTARSTQQTYNAYDLPQGDFPGGLTGYDQKYKDGQLAKSWNSKGTSWFGYDDLGRVTWKVNSITNLGTKTVNYSYTKEGLLDKLDYQKEVSGERFVHQYVYDANKQMQETKTSFDNSTFTTNQALKYYLHGALERNELGVTLQGLDYVYTINGQLKSINDPGLTNRDPGKDSYTGVHSSFKKDIFGLTLDYFTNDYIRQNSLIETYTPSGGNTALPEQYAGQIRAMRWQTTLPTGAVGSSTYTSGMIQYAYKYDNLSQLSEAIFGTVAAGTINGPTSGTSPTFTEEANAYRVNNITYDKIGNIKTLKRQGKATLLSMDDFTYNYNSTIPNRLTSITDAGSATNYTDDIKTQAANNYVYNSIGQMTRDVLNDFDYVYNMNGNVTSVQQQGINRFVVEYNELGLRQKKTEYDAFFNPSKHIWYVYDANGALLSTYETVISTGVTTQKELQVYGAGRLGVYDRTLSSYVYELADHLGNVRATVRLNGSNAEVLSFTDYYPHGSAIPGRNYVSSPTYKFGYQGQEKDAETGLNNFILRQYDGRIGRWFNPDPMGQYHSPYLAMGNNPISFIDPTGGWDGPDGEHHIDGWMDWMNEFGSSEFDMEHFRFGGGSGGSHGADGTFTSNNQWSYDAFKLYYENYHIPGVTGSYSEHERMDRPGQMHGHWNSSFDDDYGWLLGGINPNYYGAPERSRAWLTGFNDYYYTGESDNARTAANNNFRLNQYRLFFITDIGDMNGNQGTNYFVNLNSNTSNAGLLVPIQGSLQTNLPQPPNQLPLIPTPPQTIRANLPFVPATAILGNGAQATINRIARILQNRPGSNVTVTFRSINNNAGQGPILFQNRFTTISNGLINLGINPNRINYNPANNQFNQNPATMGGGVNQTLFRIR